MTRNLSDVKDILTIFSPVALCLQETNLGPKNTKILKGYTVIRRDRSEGNRLSGGVAIIVQSGIAVREVIVNSSIETTAVTILAHKTFSICSIYIPPHTPFTVKDLEQVVEQLPKPFLMVGDFNAHNTLWGSVKTDSRGQVVEDFILTNNVCLLNTGAPTYCSPSTGTMSCLDLAMCSSSLFLDFKWDIINNPYGSDHLPAVVKLTSPHPTIRSRPQRWKLYQANWPLFTEKANLQDEFSEHLTIDAINDKFTSCILSAAEQAIPQSTGLVGKKMKPWWTRECAIAKKLQNKAWCNFRRYPTYDNLLAFKQAKAKARYIRKDAEKSSWQKYITTINSTTTSKKMWDQVRKFNGDYSPYTIPILTDPGTQTSLEEQADILGEHFYTISSSANYTQSFLMYKQTAEKQKLPVTGGLDKPYNTPLTLQELKTVLSAGKKTAVGPDRIHYTMLAHLSQAALHALLNFFNMIWKSGKMPNKWKMAIVVPFLKTGKPPTSPGSYRPIALTSCMAKSYESIINIRLTYTLEIENLLDDHQCGYRKGHSTIDHLVRLEHTIREAFLHRQYCLAVFFDLEKAYDTTWRYGILRDLANIGIRGRMLNCLFDFLSNRTFQVRLGSALSHVFVQENGVPQGCVLSTTLFVVKMNSINREIPPSIMHSLYVDDLQIACRASSISTCERQLQLTINKLIKWADQNGFRFSTQKTVTVLFSQKRRLHPDPVLKINNSLLPLRQEHQFLGLMFDSKLSFIPHMTNIKRKANKALNILKVLSWKHWGADRTCLLRIYRSVVRSILDYGSVIYGSARKSYLKRLNPIHNHGLRLATGAYRTSPVESLYVESDEPCLEHRRALLTVSYVLRIRSKPSHICHTIVSHISTRILYNNRPHTIRPLLLRFEEICLEYKVPNEALNIARTPERLAPWLDFSQFTDFALTHSKKKETPRELIFQEFLAVQEKYNQYFEYYTDGSKTQEHTGSAVVSKHSESCIRLPQFVSVFTAKVYALFIAIQEILSSNHQKAVIYTDSLSTLKALHIKSGSEPFLGDMLHILETAEKNGKTIRLVWVPSHVGIQGNERADKLAAAAVHNNVAEIKVPLRDCFNRCRTAFRAKWQEEWRSKTHNKLQTIKPTLQEWKSCYHQKRFIEVILCRLRIGHTHLTHNFLLRGEEQPDCEHCKEPLTVNHILITCPVFEKTRHDYFNEFYKTQTPLHPMLILSENTTIPITNVFRFLEATGLLNKM